MSTPIVELRNVTKRFGALRAIDDVSLQIDRPDVFGLLGPNGAGKSTLLDLLVGFRTPTKGSIQVLEMDPQAEPRSIRRQVGILPDAVSVNPNWTGRRHLEFAINSIGTDESPIAALERVELDDAIDVLASDYSKGMQQRLLLSMSLVGNPELLLLDEPSTGVDPRGMEVIRNIISKEQGEGTTVVFSSHRLGQVEAVANKAGILVDGQFIETVNLDAFSESSLSVVRVYVDTSNLRIANVKAIEGVSDARVFAEGVEAVCSNDAKKPVQDIIEEMCGPIRDVTINDSSLEANYSEAVQ